MKVLVTGSRDWADEKAIERELQKFPSGTIVIHGAARGADEIAGRVAESLGFEVRAYPADWEEHGKSAGNIRNGAMLRSEHPDRQGKSISIVLAFTNDMKRSRGTKDMAKKARARGIKVLEVGS